MPRALTQLLFSLYIITICLRLSLTHKNDKYEGPAIDKDDSEIVKGANLDASTQDFINAIAKNLYPQENAKTAEFFSKLKSKRYRPRHQQNRLIAKHIRHPSARFATKPRKYKRKRPAAFPKKKYTYKKPKIMKSFSKLVSKEFLGSEWKVKPRPNSSHRMKSFDIESPLQIIESSFQNLQPGDVVLSFHITIWNRGTMYLKVMTSHTCCFMMPTLGQAEELNERTVERAHNCESMSLVGQREYTLRANETRNVTMLFASTQLLLYQYQRRGYCEIDFISERKGAGIFASTKIDFDTALGRFQGNKSKKKKNKKKKKESRYLSTANLEMEDGYFTGRLCEKRQCVPVDCVQEFGGYANRFSFYRGTCMPTPYCSPNGSLFFDHRWNRCRNVNDLRLDPVTDLDEVPQVVKESKPSLTIGIQRYLPIKDWRNLTHLHCDQLKRVAERTWGKEFLCEALPIICEKCLIN